MKHENRKEPSDTLTDDLAPRYAEILLLRRQIRVAESALASLVEQPPNLVECAKRA